jgi:hypothetical protein
MDATSIAEFAAQTQDALEACFPATLVIGATTLTIARGPWRARAAFDPATDGQMEQRECAGRADKSLLTAGSITIHPGVTLGTLDGEQVRIIECAATGAHDPAFRLVFRTTSPAAGQS